METEHKSERVSEAFYCPNCETLGVSADEDGCCVTCGADCELRSAIWTARAPTETVDTLREALGKIRKGSSTNLRCNWCRRDRLDHSASCPTRIADDALSALTTDEPTGGEDA